MNNLNKFHQPKNIAVKNPTLNEAWLEIRWKLKKESPGDPFGVDPDFPFAIGLFKNIVKERFPYAEPSNVANVPIDFLPHTIRHRFRVGENRWPLLQLGPGIAALNFTSTYNWENFKDNAIFFIKSIRKAYEEKELEIFSIILRYRNAIEYNYQDNNIIEYLENNLNSRVKLPDFVPGHVCAKNNPSSMNLKFTFDMRKPKGTGTFLVATGLKSNGKTPIIVFQYEIASGGNDVPNIFDKATLIRWLDEAHAPIHEWYFSTISGDLKKEVGVSNPED